MGYENGNVKSWWVRLNYLGMENYERKDSWPWNVEWTDGWSSNNPYDLFCGMHVWWMGSREDTCHVCTACMRACLWKRGGDNEWLRGWMNGWREGKVFSDSGRSLDDYFFWFLAFWSWLIGSSDFLPSFSPYNPSIWSGWKYGGVHFWCWVWCLWIDWSFHLVIPWLLISPFNECRLARKLDSGGVV